MPGELPTEPFFTTVKAELKRMVLPPSTAKYVQFPIVIATGEDDARAIVDKEESSIEAKYFELEKANSMRYSLY